jgi:hypothetical protein
MVVHMDWRRMSWRLIDSTDRLACAMGDVTVGRANLCRRAASINSTHLNAFEPRKLFIASDLSSSRIERNNDPRPATARAQCRPLYC